MEWTAVWPWLAFIAIILGLLALDLGVFHRKNRSISTREALVWTGVWILVSLGFNGIIYLWHGPVAGLEFLTGYLIEKSLSVDNIFVFVLIFNYFRVPQAYQHRVLFWGIIGALVLRAVLIGVGAALLARFHWLHYIMGLFLVVTAVRMARGGDPEVNPEGNRAVRLFRKIMPVTSEFRGPAFFVRSPGLMATPLFIVLILVETTDVVFAFDSIPAIFGVTHDPFIVFTSNICAILGLRALYFVLAGVIGLFEYLNLGLSLVLAFVGAKMLLSGFFEIPIGLSLGIVFGILVVSILASLIKRARGGSLDQRAPNG